MIEGDDKNSDLRDTHQSQGMRPVEDDEDDDENKQLTPTADIATIHEAPPNNGDRTGSRSRRRYYTKEGRMPRQWLFDRCDGTSKYNKDSRPPSRICFPPFIIKWCPDIMEQNTFCENMGRLGWRIIDPENTRARKALLITAFVTNVVGLMFLIVASFAITEESFNVLWHTSFTQFYLELISGPKEYDTPTFFAMGLRAAAFESKIKGESGVLSFDDFCALHDQQSVIETSSELRMFVQTYESDTSFACNSCAEISKKIVPSIFLSMLSYIPNFTTDILRMWSNYDVNCQKFMASTFSWISLATAIYTWVNYRKGCFHTLDSDPFALSEDFERVPMDSDDVFLVVQFRWNAGLGQICLALASLLKIVDIVCNCCLPTPTITRDFLEQVEYEWRYGVEDDEEE